jgi:hypothetical protein
MHADTVIALISVCFAVIIAVVVPWLTFRLALRQDQARWLREQRAQLYADMLTEAYAEKEYLQYVTADDQARERMRAHFTDLRLGPQERARLGARGTIFGSKTVNASFNRLQAEGQAIMLSAQPTEAQQLLVRVKVGGALDQLQAAIRRELGADRIPLESGSARAGFPRLFVPSGESSDAPSRSVAGNVTEGGSQE